MTAPTRPALRYHGGKWKLAPWLISRFPAHRVYTEAFGGGGSVLMRKDRSYREVYNDLDGEIVNLFKVIREQPDRLRHLLEYTPFSRNEYADSFAWSDDAMEQARRTVIRSFMGFGSNALNRNIKSGFRANSNRSGTTPAHDWANFPRNIKPLSDRLQGVVIENKHAPEVLVQHDAPDTLHYQDPPYVHSTRALASMHGAHGYTHEMTDEQHVELAAVNLTLKGMVIISGYHSELYDRLYAGWEREERDAFGDGACERTEVLWFNPAAWTALHSGSLFSESA